MKLPGSLNLANQPKLPFATAQLIQFSGYYPDLAVEWEAGDAAYGFESFLHSIYYILVDYPESGKKLVGEQCMHYPGFCFEVGITILSTNLM